MKKILYKIMTHNFRTAAAFWILMLFFVMGIGTDIYQAYCKRNKIIPAYLVEDSENCYAPPSLKHILGTDYMGRDVFYRAVAGSSSALKVGFCAGLIALFIGVSLGAAAGYFGGKTDKAVIWLYSTFASMPGLLFILAFSLLFGKGFLSAEMQSGLRSINKYFPFEMDIFGVYLAIGLTGWVSLCRVVRAETLKLKNAVYVQSARVSGVHESAILFRHILPNLFHIVIIFFTLRFAYAIMTEVIVSYLGFGVQSMPSWGMMISEGQDRLWRGIWWEVAGASFFLFVLVLSLNVLGDSLRDILDPKNQ
ncbi:MAG: ABC transporter permease [Lentisphaeria bacterium]|nr:ABC transporter permease [Lentisphaeria bacterium]